MATHPVVFDRRLLRARRRRARALGPATFLVEGVAVDLAERLSTVLRRFDLAVDLGSPGDLVRRALSQCPAIGTVIALCPSTDDLTDDSGLRVVADEEALPFAQQTLDLVVSGLSLQSVNDLPGTLVQVR